jgi:hypothetical protein
MQADKNIIDEIEERLKQLEKEKDEIENMYGIDENILKEYTNTNNSVKYKSHSSSNENVASLLKNKSTYNNLPKLDVTIKKENKIAYKTPDTLQDSLKYEPNIKDLLDDNEFEPSYTNLNNLKTKASIPKGYNISWYIENLNEDYIDNYLN